MGAAKSTTRKAVTYNSAGHVESCVFCNIVAGSDPQATSIIGRTPKVSAFHPRTPSASNHILVVPNEHIQNISTIKPGPTSSALLREMKQFGLQCVQEEEPSIQEKDCRFVFHRPPFNSVDHLHLHVHVEPYVTKWKKLTYAPGWPWCESYDSLYSKINITGEISGGGESRNNQSKL
jgi:diadenosine tetraphosphate (Ap4A) HIT family hydrolase